jgi:hypothetical protein
MFFDSSSRRLADHRKNMRLVAVDMPVEQIGQSHKCASL